MLATFSHAAFMADTPPTLGARKGAQHHADALSLGITILEARQLDKDWWQLSLDIRNSNPADVYTFLNLSHVVSVALQASDADCYLKNETEMVRSMVKANFTSLASGELEPDEITTAFHQMARTCVTYRPVEKRIDDPSSEYNLDGTYRGTLEHRNAAWLETQQAQEAAEKEAAKPTRDAWGFFNE